MTHAHALRLWAAARERAVDELSSSAARLSREGRENEAASLRAAARELRLRAILEQTQAAAWRVFGSDRSSCCTALLGTATCRYGRDLQRAGSS
jgi:hypothetical protein